MTRKQAEQQALGQSVTLSDQERVIAHNIRQWQRQRAYARQRAAELYKAEQEKAVLNRPGLVRMKEAF